jgi:hypothetical protein
VRSGQPGGSVSAAVRSTVPIARAELSTVRASVPATTVPATTVPATTVADITVADITVAVAGGTVLVAGRLTGWSWGCVGVQAAAFLGG